LGSGEAVAAEGGFGGQARVFGALAAVEQGRATASRLLNGWRVISPDVALALERIGWSNAEFCMRRQASYDLPVARNRDQVGAREYADV
jgi:plasmid maintenance system antidote protein VapI